MTKETVRFLSDLGYKARTSGGRYDCYDGLVETDISLDSEVNGFLNAIYSGVTIIELENVISGYVIPFKDLEGIYQVSSSPISKYDLLNLIKRNKI